MKKCLLISVITVLVGLTASTAFSIPISLEWSTGTYYLSSEDSSGIHYVPGYPPLPLPGPYPPYIRRQYGGPFWLQSVLCDPFELPIPPGYDLHIGYFHTGYYYSRLFYPYGTKFMSDTIARGGAWPSDTDWLGYVYAGQEALVISEAFNGMTSFSVSFNYNYYSYSLGGIIPFNNSSIGQVTFGLMDLTTLSTIAYNQINFSGAASGTFWGKWDTLDPSHSYAYYLNELNVAKIDFNHLMLADYNYSSVAASVRSYTEITDINATAVPEPATMLLLGSGLIGLMGFRRKFRK